MEEGDRNTTFFHRVSKIRRSKNLITKLRVRGEEIEDPVAIKEAILNHFKTFFSREEVLRPRLKGQNLPRISKREKRDLEANFIESEIWEVVKLCYGKKAPGPDGFNMGFFKLLLLLVVLHFVQNN